MTIQVSLSGHANGDDSDAQKAAETKLIDDLRAVVSDFKAAGGEVYSSSFSSQHNGTGTLSDSQE